VRQSDSATPASRGKRLTRRASLAGVGRRVLHGAGHAAQPGRCSNGVIRQEPAAFDTAVFVHPGDRLRLQGFRETNAFCTPSRALDSTLGWLNFVWRPNHEVDACRAP
jgi:hypothetical protein